jgi:hypothetical protein
MPKMPRFPPLGATFPADSTQVPGFRCQVQNWDTLRSLRSNDLASHKVFTLPIQRTRSARQPNARQRSQPDHQTTTAIRNFERHRPSTRFEIDTSQPPNISSKSGCDVPSGDFKTFLPAMPGDVPRIPGVRSSTTRLCGCTWRGVLFAGSASVDARSGAPYSQEAPLWMHVAGRPIRARSGSLLRCVC